MEGDISPRPERPKWQDLQARLEVWFLSQQEILQWCLEFSQLDKNDKNLDPQYVVRKFEEKGYSPDMNTGSGYRPDDADNVAGFIVGQILSWAAGGRRGRVDFSNFVKRWNDDFGASQMDPSKGFDYRNYMSKGEEPEAPKE